MRFALSFACALVLVITSAHAASPDGGYRLTGVLWSGNDASIAILELPSGGQVLIHKGSVVDGGTVVELSRRKVRIAFPDRFLELVLSGGSGGRTASGPELPRPAAARMAPSTLPRTTSPESTKRMISAGTISSLLANVNSMAPPNTDSKAYVDSQIAQAFELPAQSKIVSVNDQSVGTASEVVDSLERAFSNGVAIIGLDTPQGRQRIYVVPEP